MAVYHPRPGGPAKTFAYIAIALPGGSQDVPNVFIVDPSKVTPLRSFGYASTNGVLNFTIGMARVVDPIIATRLRALVGYVV